MSVKAVTALSRLVLASSMLIGFGGCDSESEEEVTQTGESAGGKADDFRNGSLRLRLAAFIPCEAIGGPVSMNRYDMFAGDHRGFSTDVNASVRASIDVVFGPDHQQVEIIQDVGETHELEGNDASLDYGRFDDMNCPEFSGPTVIQRSATASVTGSTSSSGEEYVLNSDGSGTLTTSLEVHAGNPLTPSLLTPPINHELTLSVEWDANGEVLDARVQGQHDPYPAHEVYLYDSAGAHEVRTFWSCGENGAADLLCSSSAQERYDWSF